MNETFYIKDSVENRISFYHLLLFLCLLPFDRFYSTLVLISFLIHTLIFMRPDLMKSPDRSVFILQSVFYITIFSSIYTVSFGEAMKVAGRQLGIFIFPFLFFYSSLDFQKYRSLLLKAVCFSSALTILYLYIDAIRVILYNGLHFSALFTWEFVNQNFTLPIHMHATYFSMLIILGMVYCIKQILDKKQTKRRVHGIIFIVLSAGLIQLSSKSAIVSFFVIMLTGVPWMLMRAKMRAIYFFCSCLLLIPLISFMLTIPVIRERFIVDLKYDLVVNKDVPDASSRIDRWKVCMDLFKQAPLLGTGSGSEKIVLRKEFFERKMYGSYLANLNAHNQYLSFLVNSGVIGLLVYLLTLGWGILQAIKFQDIYLFSFMILVIIISMSEDLLDVNKGVFIYSFFFPFLVYSIKKPSSDHLTKSATSDT